MRPTSIYYFLISTHYISIDNEHAKNTLIKIINKKCWNLFNATEIFFIIKKNVYFGNFDINDSHIFNKYLNYYVYQLSH